MISTATASSPSASTIVATLEKQNNNKTIGTVSAGMTKGRNHKKMISSQHKTEATGRRQHSPQSVTEIELERAHSLDGGPIPLRRASYAFDLHGGQQRYRHHQKSSTPPYHHPHKHGPIMNGSLMNQQHSAQGNNSVTHHQDSSDCGSSSGLGGMGTPVKGESGCSISSSSNNSVIADCSHDSRDSGGPVSSPRDREPNDATMDLDNNAQNGHRSLVATATLTQSMISPQQTTISPVSSIPTLIHQQQSIAVSQQQPQLFSAPPPGLGQGQLQSHHNPQFGAFTPAGQQQQNSLPPIGLPPPLHHHHHHFPPNRHAHPTALLQQHAAAMAQINALHAAAAVVHQTSNVTNNIGPPPCTPPINPQSTSIYDGMSSLLKSQSQQPPPQQHNQSNHQQQITYQKSGQIVIGQHQQIPMGRVLYTMTCETAALASVGAAAVTAGYHVTLEPCASAPPIIPLPAAGVVDGAIDDVQQSAAGDNNNLPSSPPTCSSSRHQQCTPPPGFRQQQAAVPNEDGRSGANGPSNDANNQQHAAGDQNGRGSMNDSTSGNADNGQQQQMNNGPAHPDITNNIMPPGVPPEIAAAISGGHDLFVHIHPGDAIALAVGNEIQHIHGPATIRMVSQSTPPSAIPMNIPQGHVVQQLLDRQGYLSHIIMSQEMPPSVTAAVRTTPSGMTTASQQQQGGGQMQIPTTDHQQYRQSQSQQNLLQPHHRPGQQQPSPQKSSTTGGRYRPSPSSSASPPNIASQLLQQQQFVLPPGGGGDQCQQMQNQPQQFTGDAGYGVHPNPLNKWTPRGTGQFQQYGGGGHRRGGHHQQQQHIPGPSNALGTFYIEPASQQLLAAATGQTPAQIASQFGQQQILLEQQQQQSSDYTIHQQQFAVSTATGGAPQIPILAPSAPYGGSPNIGTITSAEAGTGTGICIEDDEKERLRDALSSLQPPMVTRVGNRDADVVWQELDTSEAAASVPGFPEINQSEFVYQLILYEQNSSTSVCYKTDANSGNVLHLQRLRPATEYMICIRADLPGYNITGHLSAYTAFRTHSSRPDPPVMPKLISRQATACTLQWRASNCNGSSIVTYCLQMAKSKTGTFETVYEGLLEQTTINGLEPGGLYRFRLYCRNEIGQSDYSHQLNVYPERGGGNNYHQQQPTTHFIGAKGQSSITSSPCPSSIHNVIPKPHAPTVLSVTAKTAKLCWNGVQPGNDYINVSLEMSEISMRSGNTNSHFVPIPSDFYASSGTFANITGLQNNREYRFRLAVTTIHGEQIYSDTISLHTRTTHNFEHQQHEEHNEKHATSIEPTGEQQHRSPSTTQTKIVSQQKKSLSGPSQQKQQPLKTQQQQKITTTQSSQNQKHPIEETPERQQIQIAHKQPAQLQQQPLTTQKIPPICSTPKFAGITCENAKISWRMMPSANANPNNTEIQNTAMLFELQRVDRQQPQIVYSGNEMEFELKGLKPVEHLQLRVRAVWLDTEGKRFESDWSQVGSACTLSAPPSVPRNVRQIEPDSPSGGSAASTTEEMMESRSKKSSISHHGGGLGHHITHGHSIEICWDPPAQLNGASIIEYTIHAQRFPLGEMSANEKPFEERQIGSSTETQFQTPRLHPAQQYLFTVCAHNEAGASEKSEPYEYSSPPGVPDPPRDFHAQPLSTSELQLSWTEPTSNNGAIITSYHLNCYKLYNTRQQMDSSAFSLPPNSNSHNSGRQRQLVSQQIVPSSQRLLLVQSLETETDYELVLQAENSIGKSSREVIRCATLAEPPTPPELHLAQATANTLKLKWNPTGDILPTSINHNYYYYYLERENENGTYSPVYEGDLRSTKVKGLRERSTHHFRIRAAIAKGLMIGPWSKRYSFQTTRQPPPAPKQAPIAIELSTDLFQLEWNAVRCKESIIGDDQNEQQQQYVNQLQSQQQQFIYRLQIAPKVASSAKEKSIVEVWKTIYEGTSTQVTVPLPNAGQQTRQARLFVVQQFLGADGQLMDECVSAPSPITLFCTQKTPNESPKKRPLAGGPSTSGTGRGRQQQAAVHYPTQKEPKVSMYKRLKRFGSWIKKTVSEKDCALVVLFFFVLLAFGIAILLNHYYLN